MPHGEAWQIAPAARAKARLRSEAPERSLRLLHSTVSGKRFGTLNKILEALKRERAPEGARFEFLERAMRFELTTLTLARLCSTPELRPHSMEAVY